MQSLAQPKSPFLPAFFVPLFSFPSRLLALSAFSNPFTRSFCASLVSPTITDFAADTIARWRDVRAYCRFSGAERVVWEENRRVGGEGRW